MKTLQWMMVVLSAILLLSACGGEPSKPVQQDVEQSKKSAPTESKASSAQPEVEKVVDYRSYQGTWAADNYSDSSYYEGEYFETGNSFTLDFTSPTTAAFSISSISSPPAFEIASYDGQLTFIDNKAKFSVDDDGWLNSGEGIVTLSDNRIIVEYRTTKRDEMANWELGASGIYYRR